MAGDASLARAVDCLHETLELPVSRLSVEYTVAESDRPKALGRLLTEGERRELRSGGASRVACSGVLACDGAWRLFGLTAPPADDSGKAGQSSLTSFFGKKPAAASPLPPSSSVRGLGRR